MMIVQPTILNGRVVRLEPLTQPHAPSLLQHAEPDLFRFHGSVPEFTESGFKKYIEELDARENSLPFAIIFKETEQAIGVTTYLDIRSAHRGLEIGSTWIATTHQGTAVNPECKYMLLRHAFEGVGALRVQLKTDLRNLQSQRAIEKLPAKREGVLRKHMIVVNGHIRDTVMYSVTYEDWPHVRTELEDRLGYAP
jgi:ribosomal-protein-alanine N-acetyltransferase